MCTAVIEQYMGCDDVIISTISMVIALRCHVVGMKSIVVR